MGGLCYIQTHEDHMTSGRIATPTHIKEVMNIPNRLGEGKEEPQPEGDLYSAPEWMNAEQKEQWDFAIDNSPDGMLKFLDQETLAAWVVAVCLHRQAAIKVAEQGMMIKSPRKGVEMQNPYLAILNKQALLLLKTGNELGFSPAARTKLSMDAGGAKKFKKRRGPLDEYIN